MIITEHDKPLTAEEARKISNNNKEESIDRIRFREIMHGIRESASWGQTRHFMYAAPKDRMPSEYVQDILRSFGYKVSVKRAYLWDEQKKDWSDKPYLSPDGREQFVAEITWG